MLTYCNCGGDGAGAILSCTRPVVAATRTRTLSHPGISHQSKRTSIAPRYTRARRAKLVSEAIDLLKPHLYDIGRQPPRAGPGGDARRGGGAAGPRPADSRQAPPPRAAAPPPVEPPPAPSSLPKASIVISNLSSETLSSPSRLRGIFGEIGEIKVLPYLTTNNPH